MASSRDTHDPKITEFIEAQQSGIDLTQRTDYFTKLMLKYTDFNPNSLNLDEEGNSYEGDYNVTKPIDYWRYIPVSRNMREDVEEYYIRTCKPVLNLIKNPLYMLDNEKRRISKANFNAYRNELKQHIIHAAANSKQGVVSPDVIICDGKNILINLIPKELERKHFD